MLSNVAGMTPGSTSAPGPASAPAAGPTSTTRFDLSGKTALVTGGSRGLGRSMVLAFAEAGADVVIASRKMAACEELAAEVRSLTGRRAVPIACHVGRWDDVTRLATEAVSACGRIDVLVNNAGMSPLYPNLDAITEELYDKVFDVNLKGPFRLTALLGTHMKESGGGSIINVSSIASWYPKPYVIPYAAAKAGLNSMTEAFAHAFGPTVRCNAIVPGSFMTDISKAWDLEAFEKTAQHFALKRGGEPDEIVGAALYFASNASSYTTGSLLKIDGGVPKG
jgi:NAD(P)-dependent dehydrogenase (short-subunit alcohol dehydrogenase family)